MILIKNGYLIDPKSGREGQFDILIKLEKILCIQEHIPIPEEDCLLLDARGLIVSPGLVDVHVHFRDPGFTQKEDIITGGIAAARGGFTSVVLMANTKPAVDNGETLRYIAERGKMTGINVYTCANVTMGMKGQTLTPMKELARAGAAGFTDDGVPLMEENLVREAMKTAAELDMPISFHEEDPKYIGNNGINRGKASEYFAVAGSDRLAEISMVERDLQLALETGACINIQHISTKEAVELVRQAKRQGGNIHAEATPHHFTLTEDALIRYGAMAKMNPPLREEGDRQAIVEGLADGTIDIIATDHAPHTEKEKEKPITEAPSGIIGLETALSLGITKLVKEGALTMKQLLAAMSANPAQMYHLDAGYLAEGGPADLVLIDPCREVTAGKYASKSSNTPFSGWKLTGAVEATICKGRIVYRADWDESILHSEKY